MVSGQVIINTVMLPNSWLVLPSQLLAVVKWAAVYFLTQKPTDTDPVVCVLQAMPVGIEMYLANLIK